MSVGGVTEINSRWNTCSANARSDSLTSALTGEISDPVNRRTVRQKKGNECLIVSSVLQNVVIARIVCSNY